MSTKQQTESNKSNGTRGDTKWSFRAELMDELLSGYESPSDLTGPDGMLQSLIGALVSRAMQAEMTDHLGYEHGDEVPEGQTNRRNGKNKKTLRTGHGPVTVEVPRDRESSFEPKIVGKHARHFNGFDDKIIPCTPEA